MSINLNAFHAELIRNVSINEVLKKSILKFRKEESDPNTEIAFKIFLDATDVQKNLNILANDYPLNNEILEFKVSVQKTIELMFQFLNPMCLSQKQKANLTNKDRYTCFSDVSTSIYSQLYPCQFRFDGKLYANATACYLAQQYTDQKEIMQKFTYCQTTEQTMNFANKYAVTFERQKSWEDVTQKHNKHAVLMGIQKAKFEQNPTFKELLLSTKNEYIVCHGNDSFLSDGFDGTGQNILGKCLMRLRKEFGGTGEVLPNITYQIMTQEIKTSSILPIDLIHFIFLKLDAPSLLKSGCVAKFWNRATTLLFPVITKEQLEEICAPTLMILDAKTLAVTVDEEPPIKTFEVLKWVSGVGCRVEGNEGLTLLTVEKGLSINKIIQEASELGIMILLPDKLADLRNIDVKRTYRVPIANNILSNSRGKNLVEHLNILKRINCEMPAVLESLSLCLRMIKIRQIYLFRKGVQDHDWTLGCTSTQIDGCFVLVGGSSLTQIFVHYIVFDISNTGCGGRAKF